MDRTTTLVAGIKHPANVDEEQRTASSVFCRAIHFHGMICDVLVVGTTPFGAKLLKGVARVLHCRVWRPCDSACVGPWHRRTFACVGFFHHLDWIARGIRILAIEHGKRNHKIS